MSKQAFFPTNLTFQPGFVIGTTELAQTLTTSSASADELNWPRLCKCVGQLQVLPWNVPVCLQVFSRKKHMLVYNE